MPSKKDKPAARVDEVAYRRPYSKTTSIKHYFPKLNVETGVLSPLLPLPDPSNSVLLQTSNQRANKKSRDDVDVSGTDREKKRSKVEQISKASTKAEQVSSASQHEAGKAEELHEDEEMEMLTLPTDECVSALFGEAIRARRKLEAAAVYGTENEYYSSNLVTVSPRDDCLSR
ncbi:hypothetical protein IAT40_006400 [Kwoniella sp. CBS 6097]